jgi:hypothetical protein
LPSSSILTFEDKFGARTLRVHAAKNPSSTGDRTLPVSGLVLDPSVPARVNTGRWIALCPAARCAGAEYVSFDRASFFCCECRNEEAGHVPLAVTLPDEETRAAIEAALLARPDPETRNWTTETVEELLAENELEGVS